MKITELTHQILGERLIPYFDSKKLVKWAVELMKLGNESESLTILAGLDFETTHEREKYFWRSIDELKIDINKSDFEFLEDYAIHLAMEIVDNNFSALEGLDIMCYIYKKTDDTCKFIQFYHLEDDLSILYYHGTPVFNSDLTLENKIDFIKHEFELFIELQKLNLSDSIIELAYCNDCHEVKKCKLMTKFQIKPPNKYQVKACCNCHSENIDDYYSQKGKEKIIEKYKKEMQL